MFSIHRGQQLSSAKSMTFITSLSKTSAYFTWMLYNHTIVYTDIIWQPVVLHSNI